MHVEFVPFQKEWIEATAEFNRRLRQRGQTLLFPDSPIPEWLPRIPGREIYQELFLAVDRVRCVRGGYMLKHQEFWLGGKTVSIGDVQLPISEGVVNRRWRGMGVAVLRDIERREPLLFALGMGDASEAMPRLLAAARWSLMPVPFFFRIARPFPFLRNIVYLRRNPVLRVLLNLFAFSGLGWLGIRALHGLAARRQWPSKGTSYELVEEFGPWADALWEACKGEYGLCAVRDTETLRILYPKEDARFVRLRVRRHGRIVGWAVLLNNRWFNHKQFGGMRLGSIADCFGAPADADEVMRLRHPIPRDPRRRTDRRQPLARRLAAGADNGGFPHRTVQFPLRRVAAPGRHAPLRRRRVGRHALDPRRRRRPNQSLTATP